MKKQYVVKLTSEERSKLVELTRKGECKARKLRRALVLLSADEGDKDEQIAGKTRVSIGTVERIRKRYVQEGLESALNEHLSCPQSLGH